jgi:PAS domain S-box-containing protein
MIESIKSTNDVPLEATIPEGAAPLESILCTEELHRRPCRAPDYEKENRALVALSSALADSPHTILQTLAEKVLEVLEADSAGLSLLTKDEKRFYWVAVAGAWQPHIGGGTPRDFGPCADVLDRNVPLLFTHWERRYPYLRPATPLAEEGLLVPFYVHGKAVGTIWVIAHNDRRKFDAEDLRLLESLGRFASAAYQALEAIEDLKVQIAEREKAETALHELTNGLEMQVRVRTEELEQRNKEVQALRDQHRRVIDNISGMVWSVLPNGQVDFYNRRWLEYTGLPLEESLSWGWRAAIHPEDLGKLMDTWLAVLASGEPFESEVRMRRFDGDYRWFLIRVVPLRNNAGHIIKWYGTSTEIEDRKRAEDALRASEERFRLIVDGIAGHVAIMTPAGEVELVNRPGLEYFGKTLAELQGWATSDAVHPEDLPQAIAAWRRSVETRQQYDVDHRLRRADGAYRWFHARGLPLRDAESRMVRWYVLLTDIDDRKQAEEKLRRSEESLLEAQRLSHMGSWRHEVTSGTVTVSPEIHRIFGVTPEETSSAEFWFDRIHPEDGKRIQELFASSEIRKTIYQADYRIVLPDGTIKHEHSIGHPVLNESGDLVEFVGTTMDVTERKLAENALRESQENLARTEQFSLVMATHTDLEGRWLKVPPTLCKLLGYTEEELLGRRFHEFTHPDDAEAVWHQCSRLIRGELKSFDLEKRYIRKDGSIVWVYLNVSVVLDASGAPVHFRTYIRDITQHKQREQALRQSEERYRALAETATDIILTIDQTSTILFVNGAVEKAFGYTPAEIVGQKITALMPERMRHRHEEALRRYLETGEKRISWNAVPLLGLHKNGREINLDVSFTEVGTGDERFFSGIVRDVTERKRTEEALQKTQAELAHVTRVATLGEMTASIAHEINQPLAAVVNNASACLRWLAAHNLEEARQSAALVVADGHRAGEIVARIRALVKKAPPRKDWLGINDTIHEVIALVRSEVHRNGIALETQFSDDVHSVPLILADRIQVQQVLLNLIINAIEAMSGAGDGPRELLVRSGTDELQHVLVAVRDSGPGLDPQSLERLFDAFYTTKPHGLGMGLAISRSIIEAHGGRLWATANEGTGATFQFTLPTGGEKAS